MSETKNDLVTTIKPAKRPPPMSLDAVREKLKSVQGKKYWRSVDELANTPEFQAAVEREFPGSPHGWGDEVSRRGFLKFMGASAALAGLAGCTRQPDEPIYPYIKQPEDLIPGKPNYFATAHPFVTGAVPLLVKSDQYRPIKIDGNPEHPYNQGGSDPFTQATLLDLYDPDRSQHVTFRRKNREWAEFAVEFRNKVISTKDGTGIYFLSETITSPTLARQWREVQTKYPKATLVQYDPAIAGTAFATGMSVQYDLAEADVIVSLDADFLSSAAFPGFHKLVHQYAERRKNPEKLNRLYVIEPTPTTTGLKAEHRLGLRASEIPAFAAELAKAVGAADIEAPAYPWTDEQRKFLAALAKDLKAHAGKCVVIPGLYQDGSVGGAAFAINVALGNAKSAFLPTEQSHSFVWAPREPLYKDEYSDIKSLVAELNAGKVDWLVILNVNPIYNAPADLEFAAAFEKAKMIAHLGSHMDETGQNAQWHIPAAHFLESWSDARAYDGTVSIIQPMIDPLYGGKTAHHFFQALLDEPGLSPYEAVRETWRPLIQMSGDFETGWRKALHAGWIEDTAFEKTELRWVVSADAAKLKGTVPAPSPKDSLEIIFRPDPNVYDGRWANVGWLQELPKPVTNLSWDNAAIMSGATLTKYGLEEADIVELTVQGRKVNAPVIVAPGHPDNSVTVHLGYGRQTGRVAGGAGFNAYLIRTSDAPFYAVGTMKKVEGKWGVAVTKSHFQDHRSKTFGGQGNGNNSMEADEALGERGIIRSATLEEYKDNPGFANEGVGREKTDRDNTLFPNWEYKDNAWGMSIDMNSCTGCNACIVSCYAENNVPVAGKQQVRIGRNMQWLRVDTYFEGDLAAPRAHFQPMACQHCENAPCEQVCPVGATVHTPEGLNAMVYNRCVGTRYCSNNCPYKVRRFNFLLYSDFEKESLKLMRNPDVTVRSRGVMEKCTYCVQRISAAKIEADKENRPIRDGEIQTACQQACPAQAISFGNINDKQSKVAKLQDDERSYQVLADLNTRPRTMYVAAVTNPNPVLEAGPVEHRPAKLVKK
ncbi:MAG: TAT-variant-translocated molybdopterin oxidoreductase [Terracidiphilus sp.]|jgi:molybdopterin-containing oxidoreductase family iron-sulfur binding subunit